MQEAVQPMDKHAGTGALLLVFNSQPHHQLAVWPWASYLTSLSFGVFIYKTGILTVHIL